MSTPRTVDKGYGTIFEYGPDGTSWTAFAEITAVKPPKIDAADVDISNMASPNMFKEFQPGWADGGEAEMTIQFDKTANGTVYGLFRQQQYFRITMGGAPAPSGSTWVFQGYIKGFANEIDMEKIITADITVKVSGQPTYTAGTI